MCRQRTEEGPPQFPTDAAQQPLIIITYVEDERLANLIGAGIGSHHHGQPSRYRRNGIRVTPRRFENIVAAGNLHGSIIVFAKFGCSPPDRRKCDQ